MLERLKRRRDWCLVVSLSSLTIEEDE